MVKVIEKIKKWVWSVFGIPYIYVDMDYINTSGVIAIEVDFNRAMVMQLAKAGYDVSDPEEAVKTYIGTCFDQAGSDELDDDEGEMY